MNGAIGWYLAIRDQLPSQERLAIRGPAVFVL